MPMRNVQRESRDMNRDRLEAKKRQKKEKPKNVMVRLLIVLASFVLVFLILIGTSVPRQQALEVGQIAQDTIKAPRDIIDQYTTDIRVEQARENVSAKYTQDDTITENVAQNLQICHVSMQLVRDLGDIEKKRKQDLSDDGVTYVPYDSAFLDDVKDEIHASFTKGDIIALLDLDEDEFVKLCDKASTLITDAMDQGIKESALNDTVTSLNQQMISPLNNFSESAEDLGEVIQKIDAEIHGLFEPQK